MPQNFDDFMRRFEEIPTEPEPPRIQQPPEKRISPVKIYALGNLLEMGWSGLVEVAKVVYMIAFWGTIILIVLRVMFPRWWE